MQLLFRKINPEDDADIARFNALMDDLSERAQDDGALRASLRRYNARSDAWLLVAEDRETSALCGSLLAVLADDYCGACRPILLVENVVTKKEYQRRGVGRAMFAEIERWARERDVNYIILVSAMRRVEAHAFYHALGYTEAKGFKKIL